MNMWFRRKRYGYGWTPASWEGWAVLGVYVLALVILIRIFGVRSHRDGEPISFIIMVIFFTALLLLVCYQKGETPRWQWGDSEDGK